MLCSLSKRPTSHPVVSRKSGHIFDQDLIKKHIKEFGTCPVTNEALKEEDLTSVVEGSASGDSALPSSATSLPELLSAMKDEWDNLLLEMAQLRMQNTRYLKMIAGKSYQADAAQRVIARLIKERDSALNRLNNPALHPVPQPKGAPKETGPYPLPNDLMRETIHDIESKAQELRDDRKTRRKAEDWKASVQRMDYTKLEDKSTANPGLKVETQAKICFDGICTFYSHLKGKLYIFTNGKDKKCRNAVVPLANISAIACSPQSVLLSDLEQELGIVVSSASPKKNQARIEGAGFALLAAHPHHSYFVGARDNQWQLVDTERCLVSSPVTVGTQINAVQVHVDGLLLAAALDNRIEIFDLKKGAMATKLEGGIRGLRDLAFSDNGYTMASLDENEVALWDLRKQKKLNTCKVDGGKKLRFTPNGAFVGVLSDSEIALLHAHNLEMGSKIAVNETAFDLEFTNEGAFALSKKASNAQIQRFVL